MRTPLPVLLLLAGCLAVPSPPAAQRVDAATGVDHVLLVSVDALNPKALKQLGPGRTPNLHRLLAQGAGTLNARTLYEATETLPNHTAMLTGRRANLPKGTGVRFNADNGSTLARTAGHYVPGVFDVVHDNGGRTAMYVAKDKFFFLQRSWDQEHGAPDTVGTDDGRDKIDRYVFADAREGVLVRRLNRQLLAAPPTFAFLHLAAPDRAGHEYGGMTAPYLDAVRRTDRQLGKVLATIDSSPELRQHLLVVLTADHGTAGLRHNVASSIANYRIPFVVWGSGVKAGADLYALNPDFLRPGRSRPTYRGVQPIRNGDVANLVTDVLGLPRVPGSEFDVPRTLDWR